MKILYEVYQRMNKLYLTNFWCSQLNSWFSVVVWMLNCLLTDDGVLLSLNVDYSKANW